MLPFVRLGPFVVPLPPVTLVVGAWLGIILAEREAARLKLNPGPIANLAWLGLVAGVVGARLGFAAQNLAIYRADPLALLALRPEALSPGAGLLVGVLAAGLFMRYKRLPLRGVLDALAPALALLMLAVALAHVWSGDAYGAPTTLPWGIYLWSEYRHPAQFYEALLALAVLAAALKHPLGRPGAGLNFLLVVASSAGARVFLEAFRGDSLIWPGGFRAAQVMSLLLLAASLWLLGRWSQPGDATPQVTVSDDATSARE